jgi:hypothetical protein
MGRNLIIFNNDRNTIEEGRSWTASGSYSQAYGFASITMYSWWQLGEIGCPYRICNSPKGGGVKLVVHITVAGWASDPFMLPPCRKVG